MTPGKWLMEYERAERWRLLPRHGGALDYGALIAWMFGEAGYNARGEGGGVFFGWGERELPSDDAYMAELELIGVASISMCSMGSQVSLIVL